VQDPDLDSLRLRNPLQGYHWLGLVRQSCMTSRSATRWFRAWRSFPERELLPFRPLLHHRRLDGKPLVQGLLERDSRSGSRSSVLCSDDVSAATVGPSWGRVSARSAHRRSAAHRCGDRADGRSGSVSLRLLEASLVQSTPVRGPTYQVQSHWTLRCAIAMPWASRTAERTKSRVPTGGVVLLGLSRTTVDPHQK